MKQWKRTVFSGMLAFAVTLTAAPAFAGATVYDLIDTKSLPGGVKQTTVRRLMTDGWQTINIVEANLSDDAVDVKLLTNGESIHKLSTVKALANEHNTIAAVNGDFFAWKSGQSGHGSSLGIEMSDGNLLSSPADDWQMSTVARREDGSFLFDYLDCGITITAADGTAVDIEHINKFDDLSAPIVYNRFWGTTSVGSGGGIVELVVENDTIQSIHYEDGPVAIPENGYVVTFLSDYTPQMIEHFHQGEPISLSTWYVPDFENIRFAVGAGSLLLLNGEKTKITHNIGGAQPRTAIGTSADGKTAYLVTVDGRQALAKGVTLSELADILLEFGIANAANLDGGGSTTLVTKSLETGEQSVANLPSEGSLRSVVNGVGFVSTAPAGVLDSLYVAADSDTVFVNTGLLLHVTGRDGAMNIVEYDPEQLEYAVSGNNGNVEEMLFYPSETGTQRVDFVLGDCTGSKEVRVLPAPSRLALDSQQVKLAAGDRYYVTLTGYTADGYHAPINLKDVNINVSNPGVVDIIGNNLIAVDSGSTAITFEYNDVTASMVVTVGDGVTPAALPADVSKDNMLAANAPGEDAFQFVVFGRTSHNNTLAERLLCNQLKNKLQSTGELAFFVGAGAQVPEGIGIQAVKTSGFTVFDYHGSTFLTLDNSSGSVMDTDRNQWSRLVEIADTIENQNIFLFMPNADAFQNDYEKDLFYDILQKKFLDKGKQVYLFSDGSIDAKAVDGIRYFTTNGVVGFGDVGDAVRNAGYFVVTVDRGSVTYQAKPLYE